MRGALARGRPSTMTFASRRCCRDRVTWFTGSWRSSAGPAASRGLAGASHGKLFASAASSTGARVAFARVVTDRATFANLADVFKLLPAYRRRGLAKELLRVVLAHPDLQGCVGSHWRRATRTASTVGSASRRHSARSPLDGTLLPDLPHPGIGARGSGLRRTRHMKRASMTVVLLLTVTAGLFAISALARGRRGRSTDVSRLVLCTVPTCGFMLFVDQPSGCVKQLHFESIAGPQRRSSNHCARC